MRACFCDWYTFDTFILCCHMILFSWINCEKFKLRDKWTISDWDISSIIIFNEEPTMWVNHLKSEFGDFHKYFAKFKNV